MKPLPASERNEAQEPGVRLVLVITELLVASALQSSVALSWSNVLVLSGLLLVLAGETSFPALLPGWLTAGFVSLAGHVLRLGNLNRLLFHNGLATFALFFIIQFLDVAKWVADDNGARWQDDPHRTLDVPYLRSLGPSAWPALIAAAQTPNRPEAQTAAVAVKQLKKTEHRRLTRGDWRSWQWRTVVNGRRLLESETRQL